MAPILTPYVGCFARLTSFSHSSIGLSILLLIFITTPREKPLEVGFSVRVHAFSLMHTASKEMQIVRGRVHDLQHRPTSLIHY